MKTNNLYALITVLGLLFSLNTFAQSVDLSKMAQTEREKYLINLSMEVTKTYGPGYCRENSKPVIVEKEFTTDDERPEINQNIGRKYYEVTFPYDRTKERLEWNFVS